MSEAARGALPAHVADWVGAQAALAIDVQLWQGLKPAVLSAGASMTTVSAIDAALAAYATDVANQKQREAETDSNTITLTVPDLFDLFTYPAPTDTLRLDGTFRQLQIAAEFSDWTQAQTFLDKTSTVWAKLKPLVSVQAPKRPDIAGSPTVVADVDANLVATQALITDKGVAATDSTNLEVQAQKGLDQTDTCEQVFK